MDKILFVYDNLMTEDERQLAGVRMEFLTYAQMPGKLYFYNDTHKKHAFALPNHKVATSLIYGAQFSVKEFDLYEHKFCAYYNSFAPYMGQATKDDVYLLENVQITPIRFDSLTALQSQKYERGSKLNCFAFVGNQQNNIIRYNSKRYYYKLHGMDTLNFIKLVQENNRKGEEQ